MATPQLLPPGSTGIAVAIDGAQRETAAAYEDLGYDTLWIAGGQLDRLERVSELVEATRSARVATGIAPLGRYSVTALAALHRSLPGRFVLGLGGPQQPRALATLDRAFDEFDAAGVPAAQRLLAALGPRKTALARDRAAGAITLLVTPESTAATRSALGADPLLVVHQYVAVGGGGGAPAARDAVRGPLSFLAAVSGYRASFERMGFAPPDVDGLTDRLVDAVAVVGDERDVAARIAAHRAAGADQVVVSVLPVPGGPTALDVARAVAGAVGLRR